LASDANELTALAEVQGIGESSHRIIQSVENKPSPKGAPIIEPQ